jgi:hypothetical protein
MHPLERLFMIAHSRRGRLSLGIIAGAILTNRSSDDHPSYTLFSSVVISMSAKSPTHVWSSPRGNEAFFTVTNESWTSFGLGARLTTNHFRPCDTQSL